MMNENEKDPLNFYAWFSDERLDWEWLKQITTRMEVPEVFFVAFEVPDIIREFLDREKAVNTDDNST